MMVKEMAAAVVVADRTVERASAKVVSNTSTLQPTLGRQFEIRSGRRGLRLGLRFGLRLRLGLALMMVKEMAAAVVVADRTVERASAKVVSNTSTKQPTLGRQFEIKL